MQNNRINIIDELRGVMIILVAVYHIIYDLVNIFNVRALGKAYEAAVVLQPVLPFVFILISGISFNLSRNNIRRGIFIGAVALIISLITRIAVPEYVIVFGVLHFLAVMHIGFGILKPLIDRIPPAFGAVICVVCAVLFDFTCKIQHGYLGVEGIFTVTMPEYLYETNRLMVLGFHTPGFISSDYNPIFPWIFVFIIGIFLGKYVHRLPQALKKPHIRPLAFIGRHTLIIYIVHQPVIYGILWLILK